MITGKIALRTCPSGAALHRARTDSGDLYRIEAIFRPALIDLRFQSNNSDVTNVALKAGYGGRGAQREISTSPFQNH